MVKELFTNIVNKLAYILVIDQTQEVLSYLKIKRRAKSKIGDAWSFSFQAARVFCNLICKCVGGPLNFKDTRKCKPHDVKKTPQLPKDLFFQLKEKQ